MKSHRFIIQTLFLLGLWLGVGLQAKAQTGTVTYIYTDQQGTPLAEANASGTITATFDYTPYGSQALGTAPNGPGYTGHVNDPDTGLVYMQARYYDPSVGRFVSADPIGPIVGNIYNFSRYAYANNNPVKNIDINGKFPEPPLFVINFTNKAETHAYHEEIEVPAQSVAQYVPTTPAQKESAARAADSIGMAGVAGEVFLPPPLDAAGGVLSEGSSLLALALSPTDERKLSVLTAGLFKGLKFVTKDYEVASETVENGSKAYGSSELAKYTIEYHQSQSDQQSGEEHQQQTEQQTQQQRQMEEDQQELNLW